MTEVAGATALLGVAVVVVGLPVSLLLRRSEDGWVAAAAEGAGFGLVLVPLAVTAWAWLGWAGLTAVVVGWVASAALVVARRSVPPLWRRPDSTVLVLVGAWFVLLGAAGLLRLREVNFLPWLGDMGAYVNWANEFVRTGEFSATWPPLFSAWLAVGASLFGTAHTTIGMTTAGMVLVVLVARLVHVLGGGRLATLGAAAVVSFGLHTVWFSSFPASESLSAPIFVLWVLVLHRALAAGGSRLSRRAVLWSGVLLLALGLLRGTGVFLVVPLVGVFVACVTVPAWRAWAARASGLVTVGAVATAIVYWYGVARIPRYFVSMQIGAIVPRSIRRQAAALGLFAPTPGTAAVLVAGCLAVGAVALWAARAAARAPSSTERTWPPLIGLAGLTLAVMVWQMAVHGEVWAILWRMSPVLSVLGVATVAVAGWRRDRPAQLTVLLLAATSLGFLLLHAARLGPERSHSFYLYWDRYLVSEVLPASIVLTLLGAGWLAPAAVRWLRARAVRVRALTAHAVLVASVVALVVVPGVPIIAMATQDVFLRGAYPLTTQIEALAAQGNGPVFYGADGPGGVPGWTAFPNTWMAFATPLDRTFGVDVVNAVRGPTADFAPDRVLEPDDVLEWSACVGAVDFVLVEVGAAGGEPAGSRLASPGVDVAPLGQLAGSAMLLAQPPGALGWYSVPFTMTVWQVTVDARLRPVNPACEELGIGLNRPDVS